ncbi:MAG TPA: DEAD/DEAH box helicase family protein [Oculatellaceae cyanobacterium]
MSNFEFLNDEWSGLHKAAIKAEVSINQDARASCFHSRRTLELAVQWIYAHDASVHRPYDDQLSAMIHEPTFRRLLTADLFLKIRSIKEIGNLAVHSTRPIAANDALRANIELFHFLYWLARTYTNADPRKLDGLKFDPALIPPAPRDVLKKTAEQLQQLQAELEQRDKALLEKQRSLEETDAEIKRLRQEVAAAKKRNEQIPVDHDYSEAETRDFFIDLMLREAGWPLDKPEDREFPVTGMPNQAGEGFVDYVLWGDDGLPLAVVEAKRTKKDPRIGRRQAELYANCLEARFKQRPIIFYTNGYKTWIWDDCSYPEREIQGFYTKKELELLIQRRTSKQDPNSLKVNPTIVERYYQLDAIRNIVDAFNKSNRKALVVMATGTGKTRTVVALCDLLQRANWIKRVLFLADRRALVKQAVRAFKKHLPDSSPVNLLTEKEETGSRVYVSTYPTMIGLIDDTEGDTRRFGPGYFDLVIIDEAHRSVYQKYNAIFDYFDSLLVGLTATPRDEVDRNTYRLFQLEEGNPTYAYELSKAIDDHYLVEPRSIGVPVQFPVLGVTYNELSDSEKDEWDMMEWSDDGAIPLRVEAPAVNDWFFNADTVDKVLKALMTEGQKVAGGDRLAKTIIFARNHNHAAFIQERFDANYPHLKGSFARVIDNKETYAESLLDEFQKSADPPHIAISVDMLDTGVDVPEVANLVFFKNVWSKTKFFQMVGRGTRLCDNLFGPGKHKECFYIFDCCRNFEFFNQNPDSPDTALGESISTRIFRARLSLLTEIRCLKEANENGLGEVEHGLAEVLHKTIAAMNINNFLVRPHRLYVEKFSDKNAWGFISPEDLDQLTRNLARLPTELPTDEETAKQFDLLILRLQLALLNHTADFSRWQNQLREIAGQLEEKLAIPAVAAQIELIREIQDDDYWTGITVPMLELVRNRLRDLIKFIEKRKRQIVYADFEDTIGPLRVMESLWLGTEYNLERYKKRMQHFLQAHEDHVTINKLKRNLPITQADLDELDRLLFETGEIGTRKEFEQAFGSGQPLGEFVRSIIGLDRAAVVQAFGQFLEDSTYNANQIRFVSQIVDYLTQNGIMDPARLYEPPFTDFSNNGLDGVFEDEAANRIVDLIRTINRNAAA